MNSIAEIANDQEYKAATTTVERFEQALSSRSDVFDPEVTAALRQDIAEDIRVQRLRIARYDLLRTGHAKTLDLPALEDFPDMFIFARLALGFSEEQFADRLGIAAQEVRVNEETRYANVTFGCLLGFARQLGLFMHGDVIVPTA